MIKPCPFCGSSAHTFRRKEYGDYPTGEVWDVQCDRRDCYLCDGADWYFKTEEEAIEKWNDRMEAGQ